MLVPRILLSIALCVLIGVLNSISGQVILRTLGFAGYDSPLSTTVKLGMLGGLSYGIYLSIVFYSPTFFARVLLCPNVFARSLAYAILGAAAAAAGATRLSSSEGFAVDITRAACSGAVGALVVMSLVASLTLKFLGPLEIHYHQPDQNQEQYVEKKESEEKDQAH